MTEASDALVIARWRYRGNGMGIQREAADALCANPKWVAEVEALIVERGLGEQYGKALWAEIDGRDRMCFDPSGHAIAAATIRTAPLSAIVRALAATIRATKEKA